MGKILVSKPAGVFLQLIGAALIFGGIVNVSGSSGNGPTGVLLFILGGGLLWIGRKTKVRG
jgi:hypothetical protein